MKEFDLELAKKGHPVCTRAGLPAKIICFDRKAPYPVVVLVEKDNMEFVECYKENGQYNKGNKQSPYDLMMALIRHEGWVNIYKENGEWKTSEYIFPTEQEARNDWPRSPKDPIYTAKIEWEE